MMSATSQGLTLSSLFSDGMVLQREKELTVWGSDVAFSSIKVHFMGQSFQTSADTSGNWQIEIGSYLHGGPYQMTISGSSERVIRDIYIGEVWVAGGQSNMELPINRVYDAFKADIDQADYPLMRQFQIPLAYDFEGPQDNFSGGSWLSATPDNIQQLSALAYFYGQELHQALNIPIGIIHTAVGGTPVEAWMSEESYLAVGAADDLDRLKEKDAVEKVLREDEDRSREWYQKLSQQDVCLEELDESKWKPISLPQLFFEGELKGMTGSIWFKKDVYIDDEALLADDGLRLRLGTLIDADDAFINGIHVGRTDYRYPPRKYPLKKGVLKKGWNQIIVRLEVVSPVGGFITGLPYGIESLHYNLKFDADWFYQIGVEMTSRLEPQTFFQTKPTGLFNKMIAPIRGYAVNGIIFYQGESNTGSPNGYSEKLQLMVKDWRNVLKDNDLPFYFVQLANYLEPTVQVDDRQWADLRDQQYQAKQLINNSALVPTIDVGMANELHPYDKQTIAHRLATVALKQLYLKDRFNATYPELLTITKREEQYTLIFTAELELINNQQADVELQKEDGQWEEVASFIESNKLIIPFEEGGYQAIRYAWRNQPKGLLIAKDSRLPVFPFNKIL